MFCLMLLCRASFILLLIFDFNNRNSAEPIKCQCCPHIETSQLICSANQLTTFYMRATLTFNGLIQLLLYILDTDL